MKRQYDVFWRQRGKQEAPGIIFIYNRATVWTSIGMGATAVHGHEHFHSTAGSIWYARYKAPSTDSLRRLPCHVALCQRYFAQVKQEDGAVSERARVSELGPMATPRKEAWDTLLVDAVSAAVHGSVLAWTSLLHRTLVSSQGERRLCLRLCLCWLCWLRAYVAIAGTRIAIAPMITYIHTMYYYIVVCSSCSSSGPRYVHICAGQKVVNYLGT